MRGRLFPVLFAIAAAPAGSHAVGLSTQLNCASDYYAYCSSHPIGSSGLRKCMRANGPRLSKGCINALIADGEVSKSEVERTKAKLAADKAKVKQVRQDAETEQAQARAKKIERVAEHPKPAAQPKAAAIARLSDDDGRHAPKPDVRPAPASQPKAETTPSESVPAQSVLTLDDQTYEALKVRQAYFVIEEDAPREVVGEHTYTGSLPQAANPDAPSDMQSAAVHSNITEPSSPGTESAGVTKSDEPEGDLRGQTTQSLGSGAANAATYRPANAEETPRGQPPAVQPSGKQTAAPATTAAPESSPEPVSAPEHAHSKPARKIVTPRQKPEYPEGKMALGKPEHAAPAIRPVPAQSQAWQEFMSNRFNGGLNYEGVGASFSRRGR